MSRIARVTEDLGRGDGGFYIEAPDIPEGLTCQEWRARRAETRRSEQAPRVPRIEIKWPRIRRPVLRPRLA